MGAGSGFGGALVAVFYLVKYRGMRVRFAGLRPRVTLAPREAVREELEETEVTATRTS